MRSKIIQVLLELFYLSTLCEAQTKILSTFKKFQSLQLDKCTSDLSRVTSKSACARLCVSQVTCSSFTFSRDDSVCSTCFSVDGGTNLTFSDGGGDTYLKRQVEKSSFLLNNSTLTKLTLTETIYPGRVFYMRGNYADSRGIQINAFSDGNNTQYRLVTNETTGCIQINNKVNNTWKPQQKLCSAPLALNETFELHLLFRTTDVVSYINRFLFNTYENSVQSITDVKFISVGGYIFLDEVSV